MRAHMLGRWVGRIVAVVAVSVGAIGGVAAVAAADGLTPNPAVVGSESTGSADDATEGHEWA